MTQEQKDAVRTRDEQVIELSAGCDDPDTALAHIREAEARGAEEARRVDAEGQEPFAYVSQEDANTPKNAQGLEQFGEYCDKKYEYFQVPLYTRPANVGAGIDIDAVIRTISELPDRTSPDDHPDLLMVTTDELRQILSDAQAANGAALEARVKELEARERKDQEVIHWLAEKLKQADPEAKADYELLARAALAREGGE